MIQTDPQVTANHASAGDSTIRWKYAIRSACWDAASRLAQARTESKSAWARLSPATYSKAKSAFRRVRRRNDAPPASRSLPPRGSVITIAGIRLRLDESLSDIAILRLASGRHTRYERRLILGHLAPDDTVMELGGGVGMLAIACAQKIGSDRIYSYEANPMLEPLIRDNCELNGVTPHFEMCILGLEPGSRTFYVSKEFNRSSSIGSFEGDVPIEVPVKDINEEMAQIKPTFLIMDVQGDEDRLLGQVDLSGVTRIAVEFHPHLIGDSRVRQLRKSLRRQGYVEIARESQCILYARKSPG